MRKKREYHLWFQPEIAEEIDRRAKALNRPPSHIVESFIQAALTAEEGERMEKQALPLLRTTLGEDQAAALEMLRQQIRGDIEEITQKHTDRLAALLVRAGRAASLTWRLVYRMIQKQHGNGLANDWYNEAYAQAGKAMASRTDSGKEIEK